MNVEKTTEATHLKAATVERALELALAQLRSNEPGALVYNGGACAVQVHENLFVDVTVTAFPVVREAL